MLTQPLIETLLTESPRQIQFEGRCCLRARFNKNECSACVDQCSSNALVLTGRTIVFNPEKCTSCMHCVAVCPNDAFSHTIDTVSFLQRLAEKNAVIFSCKKGISNPDHVLIPCVGFFSEPLLAAMNSITKDDCCIDISRCAECVNGHCEEILHENIQNLNTKMGGNGKIRLKFLSEKQLGLPSDEKTERRSFLRLVRNKIADMGRDAVTFQLSDSAETKKSHSKNQTRNTAILHYVLTIVPDERVYEKEVLLSYFFSVSANEQCDCCPSCTGMCPTGALKRKKEKDKKHLTFTSINCSGCGLCVQFCRKNALTMKSGFSGDPYIVASIAD
jgi:ferredoxin